MNYKTSEQLPAEALNVRLEAYNLWFKQLSETSPEEAKRVAIEQLTQAGILDKNGKVRTLTGED